MASYTTATTATTSLRFSMHDRNEIFIPNLEGCLADAARHTSEFDFSGPVYEYVPSPRGLIRLRRGDALHAGLFDFELAQDEPAKEKNMKALYEFYAINRRTLVHLLKMVVASADEDEALSQILLEHAEEIKLNVGKPSECVFDLIRVFSFEPIEDKD